MSDLPPAPAAPRSYLIWFVPLIAALISAWLLHREFRSRGPVIEIDFADGAGLQAGKTPVMHKGVTIGLVRDVALSPALDGVRATVELDHSAAALAVEGSDFWIVHPEIGLSGVRGLDTLLSGARIHARPGKGAPLARFRALAKPPAIETETPGTNYTLRTNQLRALHAGTAIYYREVKVGVVAESRLAEDASHVLVAIRVHAPYDRLVRTNTRFWNSGGITMKLGLAGAQVHTNSLESLVAGGISFATPDDPLVAPATDGALFDLHDEGEKSWLRWTPRIDLSAGQK